MWKVREYQPAQFLFDEDSVAVRLRSLGAFANGFVYEPLVFVDELNNQAETPMLATGYQWNADKTSIVFTIRGGVTATRVLVLACLVVAALMVVAHLVAIMASRRLR